MLALSREETVSRAITKPWNGDEKEEACVCLYARVPACTFTCSYRFLGVDMVEVSRTRPTTFLPPRDSPASKTGSSLHDLETHKLRRHEARCVVKRANRGADSSHTFFVYLRSSSLLSSIEDIPDYRRKFRGSNASDSLRVFSGSPVSFLRILPLQLPARL